MIRKNLEYLSGLTTEEQEAQEYPAAITDEGGRTRRYEYTDLGQLYRATDLSGAAWWTNQFDTNSGALLAVISPTAETNRYVYDDLDNVKALGFADQNWLTNFYNAENRLSGVRLPTGVAVTNLYDFAGRLTNRSSTVGETASFEYNGNDAVTKLTDNTGSTTNLYDAAGRLWGVDYPSGASVRYELDKLDRITAITNKATAAGTNYVTRYQYDPIGNVTNVIDPFNGNTKFEYDAAGRRTKRTLPNNVVTEWQYDWRDRVTNITHKIGTTNLASVLYERLAGGEPSKITREDGTYVELKYDSALRLTNEVYYTNTVAQTTNSYAYDASGSRIKLVKGPTTLTNAVTGGYRITEVKQGSTTVETYGYDNGGRVTQIVRDSKTWNLGYNTVDQVSAVTNSTESTWVTYLHDATGRRTMATNSVGTVRRLLVAPTPGSDLESPHLIANASGSVQQGYVYLGDDPLLRYTTNGTAAYYLEDGMGSIIGIAPASSPGTGNTTRLFYDGFGNQRATNGPAPAIPTGAAGDFRFHGAWLEEASGLYNMRAREYDARMGRFTSRDPVNAFKKTPETFNAFQFANGNSHVFADPSGMFTLIEININSANQMSLGTFKTVAINKAKNKGIQKLQEMLVGELRSYLESFLPDLEDVLGPLTSVLKGDLWQGVATYAFCDVLRMPRNLYFETGLYHWNGPEHKIGDVAYNGFGCAAFKAGAVGYVVPGVSRPDFIISPDLPSKSRAYLVGDFKLRASTIYNAYRPGGYQTEQFDAIAGYAENHAYRVAVMLTVFAPDNKKQMDALSLIVKRAAVSKHFVLFIFSLQTKRF